MARHIVRLVGLLVVSLATAGVAANVEPSPDYDLTVEGDKVSLRVSEGRLLDVVEDLGRRLGFEVVATSVDNLRISTEFQGLPSREAIRKICASVGYVEVPDPNTGRIMRLVVTGGAGANRLEPRRDPLPEQRDPPVQMAPKLRPQPEDSDEEQKKEEQKKDEEEGN